MKWLGGATKTERITFLVLVFCSEGPASQIIGRDDSSLKNKLQKAYLSTNDNHVLNAHLCLRYKGTTEKI